MWSRLSAPAAGICAAALKWIADSFIDRGLEILDWLKPAVSQIRAVLEHSLTQSSGNVGLRRANPTCVLC
jgi:hypothetical protein